MEDQRLRNVRHGSAQELNTHETINVHMHVLAHIYQYTGIKGVMQLHACNCTNCQMHRYKNLDLLTHTVHITTQTHTMLRCRVQRHLKISKFSPLNRLREVEDELVEEGCSVRWDVEER